MSAFLCCSAPFNKSNFCRSAAFSSVAIADQNLRIFRINEMGTVVGCKLCGLFQAKASITHRDIMGACSHKNAIQYE